MAMKKIMFYICTSCLLVQTVQAQFIVEKNDGTSINELKDQSGFSQNGDAEQWAYGDEYAAENDLANIAYVRRAFPSVPFDSHLYYGRSLLTEQEQKAYDHLLYTLLTYQPEQGSTAKRIPVDFASAGIEVTYEQLLTIGKYMQADEPRLLMVQSIVPRGHATDMVAPPAGNVGTVYYEARFYAVSMAYSIQANNMFKVETAATRILDKLQPDMDDAQKFRVLHDEFIKLVSYGGMSTGNSGTIEGAFIPNQNGYHAIVCQGYAKGLQYLCQRAGIPVIYVTGTASYSEPPVDHAWNMVQIGGQWYHVDPTNDDPPTGATIPVRYEDFLQSDADFLHDHKPGVSTQGEQVSYPEFPQVAEASYPLEQTEYPRQ